METEPKPAGRYTFTFKDVPVDAFWSVSIYNRDGDYEANTCNSYNLNSVTAEADPDGAVTLNLAPEGDGLTNHPYVTDGWNYALRLYRPRPAVLNKTWTPPAPHPSSTCTWPALCAVADKLVTVLDNTLTERCVHTLRRQPLCACDFRLFPYSERFGTCRIMTSYAIGQDSNGLTIRVTQNGHRWGSPARGVSGV